MVKYVLKLLFLVSLTLGQDTLECDVASNCVPEACLTPECVCSSSAPGFSFEETPQIVYLTFDDGFTALAEASYFRDLFDGTYTNPNGCPIRATHFLSHLNTDYTLVHQYRSMGHEIASHSITHRLDPQYWRGLNASGWNDELYGMKQMALNYGDVPLEEIVGVRAPYLQGGGNEQFSIMNEAGLEYDASMSTRQFGYTNIANGLWPFTYDYRSQMDCNIEPCPTCSFPGVWQQPMLQLEDNRFGALPGDPSLGVNCDMLDSCIIPDDQPQTAETVFEMLKRNFDRVHDPSMGITKAPFGLYLHAAWFFGAEFRYDGYKMFLEYITEFEDVWVVPIKAGIAYRKMPVPNSEVGDLEEFKCDNFPENTCNTSKNCRYVDVVNDDLDAAEIYMNICGTVCPDNFPWLGNPHGI